MTGQIFYQLKTLGDPHNFGKSTYLRSDGKVVKPRNTAWEQAFLWSRSPLRQQLDLIARGAGLPVPLPDLAYRQLPQGGSSVDALKVEPLCSLTALDLEATGVLLATAFWFGIADLDGENIVCGRDAKGKLILGPADIESVLAPHTGLDETGLISGQITQGQSEGLKQVRDLIRSSAISHGPSILVGSFSSFLCLLQQNRHDLTPALAPLLLEPVRIRLRGSDYYRSESRTDRDKNNGSLLDEEKLQLTRGDIPYFFSLPNKDPLYWFDTGESLKPVKVSDHQLAALAQKLPVWPQIYNTNEFSKRIQRCIQNIVSYFWQNDLLQSAYSGFEVSNGPDGLHIKSGGSYLPIASE